MVEPVDEKQRQVFLAEAEQLDYDRRDFTFPQSVTHNADTSISDLVRITRGSVYREYPHGGDIRWLGDALRDLYCGAFGEPAYQRSMNQPIMLSEGALKGKWMANAWFKGADGTRTEFTPSDRIYDSEVDAFRSARNWLVAQRVGKKS